MLPGKIVSVTDNIMPDTYFEEMLPVLSEKDDFPPLAFPMRANLQLSDLVRLKKAGIYALLLGIETFSTPLLKLMRKGRQRLAKPINAAKCPQRWNLCGLVPVVGISRGQYFLL